MNALLVSALSGVIMMFSGFALNRGSVRTLAQVLFFLVIVATALELRGVSFFHIDTKDMLSFDRFSLLFSLLLFDNFTLLSRSFRDESARPSVGEMEGP